MPLNLTDGNVDDLGKTGEGFGPGDFTAAFQWSVMVGVGEYVNFLTQFGGDTPLVSHAMSPVPEPTTALLVGLCPVGLGAAGRKVA